MTQRMVVSLALALLLACGGSEPVDAGTSGEAAGAPPETKQSTASAAVPIDFSAADLDLYERGIAQEIAVVKGAQERAMNASTPAERGEAAQQTWEEHTIPAAAKAAGIDESRYRATRNAVHHVFETLDFQGKIDGPLSMDLSRANEETKQRLARDAFETLTPAAAALLRERMDRLVVPWKEYVTLTAVAG